MNTPNAALQQALSSRWSWLCPRVWLISPDYLSKHPNAPFFWLRFQQETQATPARMIFYFRRRKGYVMPLAVPLDVIAALCEGMTGTPLRRLRRLAHLLYVMHCEYWASRWGANA